MIVYGVSVSYYTGKLETYLRYKGIDYTMTPPYADAARIREQVGAIQVPIVERDDGRWMSDSTPMILQLEQEHPTPGILPTDPVVRFISLLIEDYADEWLWRPAMHYRWSYDHGRELLSRILADEIAGHLKVPRWMTIRTLKKRQHTSFVIKDGVTADTWDHVEQGYFNALDTMTSILGHRPYILGNAPSLADFGLMGPMLRHFAQDPDPQEIMRNRAPAVYEWVARMWHAQHPDNGPVFLEQIDEVMTPMLHEICETHLVQLRKNAAAFDRGAQRFEMTVQGCQYRELPVSRYRVWCLQQLKEHFSSLPATDQEDVRNLLPWPEAAVLWDADTVESGYDEAREAPFNQAINVYGNGTPD